MPSCPVNIKKEKPSIGKVGAELKVPTTSISIGEFSEGGNCKNRFDNDVLCYRIERLKQQKKEALPNWGIAKVESQIIDLEQVRIAPNATKDSINLTIEKAVSDSVYESRVASALSAQRSLNFQTRSLGFRVPFEGVLQINPGVETPKGTPGLPSNGPMALDTANGQPCARPATATDWTPNSDGRTNILVNSRDFREVGEIVRAKAGEYDICGFVVVADVWAITALHCVAQKSGKGTAEIFSDAVPGLGNGAVRYLVFEGRLEQDTLKPCFDETQASKCPGTPLEVEKIVTFGETWQEDVPRFDLALLKFKSPVPAWVKPAKFVFGSDSEIQALVKGKLTTAGYGRSNAKDYDFGYGLLVGWHDGGKLTSTSSYSWTLTDQRLGTIPCGGDSGSAVFGGEYFGRTSERRTLFGVVSYLTTTQAAAEKDNAARVRECKQGVVSAVVLNAYRKEICTAMGLSGTCQ
jgi:V8-like Glu-specific endopeptidase